MAKCEDNDSNLSRVISDKPGCKVLERMAKFRTWSLQKKGRSAGFLSPRRMQADVWIEGFPLISTRASRVVEAGTVKIWFDI